jgi:hypothetical protein
MGALMYAAFRAAEALKWQHWTIALSDAVMVAVT